VANEYPQIDLISSDLRPGKAAIVGRALAVVLLIVVLIAPAVWNGWSFIHLRDLEQEIASLDTKAKLMQGAPAKQQQLRELESAVSTRERLLAEAEADIKVWAFLAELDSHATATGVDVASVNLASTPGWAEVAGTTPDLDHLGDFVELLTASPFSTGSSFHEASRHSEDIGGYHYTVSVQLRAPGQGD